MKDAYMLLSSGRKLGYAEFGDPAGVPAFYFHGWPCSRLHGRTMHEEALRLGIRLVCPDRPGLGLSDAQPDRQLTDWPPVLEELANHLGWKRFHVIGVSGGGPYALVSALMLPHRLLSNQVICGAPPIHDLGSKELFWIYRLLIRLRRFSPMILGMALLAGAGLAAQPQQHLPVRALMGMLAPCDQECLRHPEQYQTIAGSFRQAVRNGPSQLIMDADIYLNPWSFDLADIRYPVHFWHGGEDRNISWNYAQKIARHLSNSTTHLLPEEGHYSLPVNHAADILGVLLENHRA